MPQPLPTRVARSTLRSRASSGFTLMEVLLVLAILAMIGATAWPLLNKAYSNVKLRNAAQQVQACWGRARVSAVSKGLPHVFRFETNAADYSVVPWQDENAALEATMPITESTFAQPTSPSVDTTYSGAATTTGPKLPEGMTFVGIERGNDTRTFAADAQLATAGITATSPAVVFYPDGTSSDVVLTITDGKGRYITVNLRGLTGITRIGDVTAGPEVAK